MRAQRGRVRAGAGRTGGGGHRLAGRGDGRGARRRGPGAEHSGIRRLPVDHLVQQGPGVRSRGPVDPRRGQVQPSLRQPAPVHHVPHRIWQPAAVPGPVGRGGGGTPRRPADREERRAGAVRRNAGEAGRTADRAGPAGRGRGVPAGVRGPARCRAPAGADPPAAGRGGGGRRPAAAAARRLRAGLCGGRAAVRAGRGSRDRDG